MKLNPSFLHCLALAFACLLQSASFLLAQGSLTPPSAPAPTMKSLQQIEPRIDLLNAPASAVTTTDANYHYIINQPGSYYLSANIGVTKTNGIQINADGVALDLSGFELSRATGTGGDGIEISAASHRASVRNGSIKGFANGIESLFASGYARGCAFRDLAVSACTACGIFAGHGALLETCRAHDNSGNGLVAAQGSSLTNCTAIANGGNFGIHGGEGSSLTNCSASNNSSTHGIYAHTGSSLTNCSALFNSGAYGIYAQAGSLLTNCSARTNAGDYGIYANNGSSLINCSASNNTGLFGIYAGIGSSLTNCTAFLNSSTATTSGGFLTGDGCTITNCTATFASTSATPTGTTAMGFMAGSGSTMLGCTARNNTGNGINAGARATLSHCTAVDNSGDNGIVAGEGSTLVSCTATNNSVEYGINAGQRSTLKNCTVSLNTSAAAESAGILAGAQCTITDCTAAGNLNTNGTPTGNTGMGIFAGNGSLIKACVAAGNKGDGIRVTNDCLVSENTCDSSGVGGGDAAGIHASSNDNRIEGNNVTDSTRGIDVDNPGNIIIKNTASGNTTNWDVAAGNIILVVSGGTAGAVLGNSGGTAPGSTDPNANFTY